MAEIPELDGLFSVPGQSSLPNDILGELLSIQRMHEISAQELFYKWESYSIKMGSENTHLDLETVRAFKKDVQEILEREALGKTHVRDVEELHDTPRATRKGDNLNGLCVETSLDQKCSS